MFRTMRRVLLNNLAAEESTMRRFREPVVSFYPAKPGGDEDCTGANLYVHRPRDRQAVIRPEMTPNG